MQTTTAWLLVLIGGALEIIWAIGFKYEVVPGLVVLVALILSLDLLTRAAKHIPIGTAYAVFVGIGTIGTVIAEAILAQQHFSLPKVGIILFLLLCMIGLKLTSKESAQ